MNTRTALFHDGRTIELGGERIALTVRAAETALDGRVIGERVAASENVGRLLNSAHCRGDAASIGAMGAGAEVFIFDGTSYRWDRATVL